MGRRVASKRMRVYSLETNKLQNLAFAKNYVNHLVPALKKRMAMNHIKRTTSPKDRSTSNEKGDIAELAMSIRLEVDTALALSAKGFAWSRALEAKLGLQREEKVFASRELIFSNTASQNPKCDKEIKKPSCSRNSRRLGISKRVRQPKKSEEEVVKDKVALLRTLLPGGSENMEANENAFLVEVASYINCLKSQVKVLQCLVEGHD